MDAKELIDDLYYLDDCIVSINKDEPIKPGDILLCLKTDGDLRTKNTFYLTTEPPYDPVVNPGFTPTWFYINNQGEASYTYYPDELVKVTAYYPLSLKSPELLQKLPMLPKIDGMEPVDKEVVEIVDDSVDIENLIHNQLSLFFEERNKGIGQHEIRVVIRSLLGQIAKKAYQAGLNYSSEINYTDVHNAFMAGFMCSVLALDKDEALIKYRTGFVNQRMSERLRPKSITVDGYFDFSGDATRLYDTMHFTKNVKDDPKFNKYGTETLQVVHKIVRGTYNYHRYKHE